MKRISVLGVLVGGIVDVVTTFMLELPLAVYMVVRFGLAHVPKGSAQASMAAVLHSHPLLYSIQVLIGVACSLLGGYVAGWLAKHDERLNGMLSSYLCVLMGIYSIVVGKSGLPLWVHVILLAVSPALGWYGGYLRELHKRPGLRPA
jgi:hypothetical protein